MGDDIWKSDNSVTGVEAQSDADQRLPASPINSQALGSPSKVPNGAGQPLNGRDVVLSIDGENSCSFGAPLKVNGKVKLVNGLGAINGSVISFRDLSYRIEVRARSRGCSCRKESQYILKNVRYVSFISIFHKNVLKCFVFIVLTDK